MKLLPFAAAVAALALASTVLAQQATKQAATPTTQAACEKANMKWDAKGGKDAKGACVAAPAAPAPGKSGDAPKK